MSVDGKYRSAPARWLTAAKIKIYRQVNFRFIF